MTSGQPEQFELVFDGPLDESPDTLRRLKGVFIAELEFTIDQTIQVLQKFPVTVKRSDSEQSLTKYFNALESAGAKVLLVRPKVIEKTEPSPSEPVTVGDTELWEVDNSQNDKLIAAHTAEELAPITIEFSINPAEAASPVDTGDKPTARPKTTQVYELTDDMDLATALREAEAAPSPIQDHTEIPSEAESAVAQSTLQEVIPVPSESVSLPLVTEPIAASLEIAETPTIEVSPPAPVAPAEVVASSPATQAWTLELELDEPKSAAPEILSPTPPAVTAQEFLLSSVSLEENASHAHPTLPSPSGHQTNDDEPLTLDLTNEVDPTINSKLSIHDSTVDPAVEVPPAVEEPIAALEIQSQSAPLTPPAETKAFLTSGTENLVAPTIQPLINDPMPGERPALIEAAPQAHEVADVKNRTPRSVLGLPLDVVGPIIVGAILLGAANWWVFNRAPDAPEISLSSALSPMTPMSDEDAPPPIKRSLPPVGFLGHGTLGELPCEVKIVTTGNKLRSIKLSFDPPPPRELTPEEIVEGNARDPWVRRVDIDDLRITNQPQGGFEGMGPARLTIDDKGAKRFVTLATVKGSWTSEAKVFAAHVEIKRESDQALLPQPFSIVRRDFGQYDVSLDISGEITLAPEQLMERAIEASPQSPPSKSLEEIDAEKKAAGPEKDPL